MESGSGSRRRMDSSKLRRSSMFENQQASAVPSPRPTRGHDVNGGQSVSDRPRNPDGAAAAAASSRMRAVISGASPNQKLGGTSSVGCARPVGDSRVWGMVKMTEQTPAEARSGSEAGSSAQSGKSDLDGTRSSAWDDYGRRGSSGSSNRSGVTDAVERGAGGARRRLLPEKPQPAKWMEGRPVQNLLSSMQGDRTYVPRTVHLARYGVLLIRFVKMEWFLSWSHPDIHASVNQSINQSINQSDRPCRCTVILLHLLSTEEHHARFGVADLHCVIHR